jgi:hypothetical protein
MSLGDYGSAAVAAAGELPDIKESYKYFPNMRALHPDTRVQVFREYKPMMDTIEITVFYREPGKDKYRFDATLKMEDAERVEELGPEHFKINNWCKAELTSRLWE